MHLKIDGQTRALIPVKDFRAKHGLPPTFGVAWFEPKDYTGLGRIDRAGAELNAVRATMLAALPEQMAAAGWLTFLPDYARLFEQQLYEINPQVGLKDVEIEFAVAGLSDALHQYAYALLRARSAHEPPPDFRAVYAAWLDNSVKVFSDVYPFEHEGERWTIQVMAHAYGRIGLVVHMTVETVYVYDPALGCPAEGFMAALLNEIAARMALPEKDDVE